MIPRRVQRVAEGIAYRLPGVLAKRRLKPAFSGYFLTEVNGMTLLIARLSAAQVETVERYLDGDLLEQMRLELGYPVYPLRKNGLGYAVLLSSLPKLPRRVEYPPDTPVGQVVIGQGYEGMVSLSWNDLGHVLVAGQTGSGKSVFLRLLVYQALRDGMHLLLADMDQATFPMLAGHPALMTPIAATTQDTLALIQRGLEECDRRGRLYQESEGFPGTLEEYNQDARATGKEVLPRILVVLDEFSSAAAAEPQLKAQIAALGWRGRKFGIQVVFAAQEFTKEVVGAVREQVNTAVCFRVRSADMARRVGCAGAERIPPSRPGLAVSDRWGPIQTCYVDKSLFGINSVRKAALTAEEQQLAERAAASGGHISIPLLVGWGWSEWKARRLLESWELRGWIERDGVNRRISARLRELLSNPQTPQTASNPSNRLKALIEDSYADVSASEGL